jgi:hypothetical protein
LSEGFPITLVRLQDPRGVKLWFISRQTLDRVPEVYDSLRFPRLEKVCPPIWSDTVRWACRSGNGSRSFCWRPSPWHWAGRWRWF